MAPNEKGFVGYETVWKPFQKEVEYKTPSSRSVDPSLLKSIHQRKGYLI